MPAYLSQGNKVQIPVLKMAENEKYTLTTGTVGGDLVYTPYSVCM